MRSFLDNFIKSFRFEKVFSAKRLTFFSKYCKIVLGNRIMNKIVRFHIVITLSKYIHRRRKKCTTI